MPKLRVEPAVWLLGAALLLILPLNWLLSALIAAVFHELCHWAAVRVCGGRIHRLYIGIGGAVMDAPAMEAGAAVLCAAAGPVGSLSLLLFARFFPGIALCGAVQGIFNLLPLYPLDGGRILRILASKKTCEYVRIVTVVLLLTGWILVGVYLKLGIITALIPAAAAKGIKYPCKEGKEGVQ